LNPNKTANPASDENLNLNETSNPASDGKSNPPVRGDSDLGRKRKVKKNEIRIDSLVKTNENKKNSSFSSKKAVLRKGRVKMDRATAAKESKGVDSGRERGGVESPS
jgi:hypothetical protein